MCRFRTRGFRPWSRRVAPDFGAGSWRVPFPDIRAGHHRFAGCHSKEQPKRNRKLTHFGAHFGCSRAVLALIDPLGKSIKFEPVSAEGACIAQKFRLVRLNNFHSSWVTQFCQLRPFFPHSAKNVPIGVQSRRPKCPKFSGRGLPTSPSDFGVGPGRVPFPDISEGHHQFSGRQSEEQPKRNLKLTHFGPLFWVFLGCFGLGHPPGEGHISSSH